jgi:hypothetical protein
MSAEHAIGAVRARLVEKEPALLRDPIKLWGEIARVLWEAREAALSCQLIAEAREGMKQPPPHASGAW